MNDINIAHDAAQQFVPLQNAFKVLFGRTTAHGHAYHSPYIPSIDEEWNAYYHMPNWLDITKIGLVQWWEVCT